MKALRFLSHAHRRALLGCVLAALGMQALVPAGLMVAPASGHGAQIILCPQTHPLARAAAAQASAEMVAVHKAMGHAVMDHAAMGHAAPGDDPSPAPSTASSAQSCAFAGAGGLAGLLPDEPTAGAPRAYSVAVSPLPLRQIEVAVARHLRPPLRAPPAQT